MKTNDNLAEIIEQQKDQINQLEQKLMKLEELVRFYEGQFRLAQHLRYGASSEKSSEQLSFPLFNEAEATADATFAEPDIVEVEKHYRKAKRTSSDRLPDGLPVEIVTHELPADEQTCPECSEPLHTMGREIRKELKIVPAQAIIVEHVQFVYACRNCEKNGTFVPIIKAPTPEPVISGSFASPEAVAHIMTQKYVMGSPLYRLEQEFQRDDIMLSRQTMSNWLIRCAENWLEPIYERMKAILLEHDILHADESTHQVLHEPGKTAQSKSYMWLYRTGGDAEHPIVIYEYQPDRRAIHPMNFLHGWTGYLHTDGYEGYHKLPEGIIIVGCLSHCRRKYDEALKTLPKDAREGSSAMRGLQYCNALFKIERDLSDKTPEERLEKRQETAKPLIEKFFAWAESLNVLPKSAIGQAVFYTLSQRKYLERFLLDGRLEISNNRAERSIKPYVIGRKNWMFSQTPNGARASSIIYSIVETAKENGLNPYSYLVQVLRTAPNIDLSKDTDTIDSLMPWQQTNSKPIADN